MGAILYDYNNFVQATSNPAGVVVSGTPTAQYFKRYLLEKLIAQIKFELPKEWASNFFRYCLFCGGYVAVFYSDKFGTIFQPGVINGYNIFYQPTHITVTNPLLPGVNDLEIGKDCELIKLQPNYCGIMDIINLYGDMMAQAVEAVNVNLFNTKLAYVFACKDDKQAQSFKKMYDQLSMGTPAIFSDRTLYDDEGKPAWQKFDTDPHSTYITDKLLADLKTIEDRFRKTVGIPIANSEKKERLITDEVEQQNADTSVLLDLWLETISEGVEKVNEKYNLTIKATKRYNVNGGDNYVDEPKN